MKENLDFLRLCGATGDRVVERRGHDAIGVPRMGLAAESVGRGGPTL